MDYPIGTILPYAGYIADTTALWQEGWLLCDDTSLGTHNSNYQALHDIIGFTYGSAGNSFYLPDFRGQFLRGADNGRGKDPEAATRTHPRPDLANPGTSGDNPGSVQDGQIASHTHTYSKFSDGHYLQNGLGSDVRNLDAGSAISSAIGGAENRPVNMSVYYIIKGKSDKASDTPIGTILLYAGAITDGGASLHSKGWLPCDGRPLLATSTSYQYLYAVIDATYGATGSTDFFVPDYRGVFHRGVDSGKGRDPEASERNSPRYDTPVPPPIPGNKGDNVGSLQNSQFANHAHNYFLSSGRRDIINLTAKECMKNNAYSRTSSNALDAQGTPVNGTETRPINISVHYLICFDNSTTPSSPSFQIPIGAIIGYSVKIADPATLTGDTWMLCAGQDMDVTQYRDLYNVIGTMYGGDPENSVFCLPDYQGMFLRGVDHGRGKDPDANTRSSPRLDKPSPGNAKDMVGSVQSDTFTNHTHIYTIFQDTAYSDYGSGDNYMNDNTVTEKFNSIGGSETRPTNASVNYLIKVKDVSTS